MNDVTDTIMEPVKWPRFLTREGAVAHLERYGWIKLATVVPSWAHTGLPGVTRFISRDRADGLVYFLERRPWEQEKQRIKAEVDPDFVLIPRRAFPTPHIASHCR